MSWFISSRFRRLRSRSSSLPASRRRLSLFVFLVALVFVNVVAPLGAIVGGPRPSLGSVFVLAATESPWLTVGEKLCELFLDKLGKALAIVAVIIGGLMYAFGEGGSKSQIAGLAFGAGMVLLAPQFLSWILGTTVPGCA